MKQQKQKGIVLLSCLVFLLILTSLVKYTMSSAKMEELKAGADFDEMSAKEAALLAIKDAEDVILRRTWKNGKKQRLNHSSQPDGNVDATKFTVRQDGEYAVGFWKTKNNWLNREKISGVYDGDSATDRCNDEICDKNTNVKGLWYQQSECSATEGPVICYGQYTGRNLIDKTQAKYIIEVFHPEGQVLKGVLANDPDGMNTLVLRVTAVGYSQKPKDEFSFNYQKTGNSGIPNDTYALYQATYILSSD